MDATDQRVSPPAGAGRPHRSPRARLVRAVVGLVVLGLAVHLLLPAVGEFEQTGHSLARARPVFIVLAVLFSATSYVGSSVTLRSATRQPLAAGRAAASTLAASALQAVAPANIGTYALYVGVLRSAGASVADAASAVALNTLAPILVGGVVLVVASLLLGRVPHADLSAPHHLGVLLTVVAVLVALGAAGGVWWCRRRHVTWAAVRQRIAGGAHDAAAQLRALAHDRRRAAGLFAGATLSTASYVACLFVSVHAFGGLISVADAAFVYVVATLVAAVAPTPGGLGAVEAAMVSGLGLFGSASGTAVAGVLLYRLVTFWLPIPVGVVTLRRLRRDGVR